MALQLSYLYKKTLLAQQIARLKLATLRLYQNNITPTGANVVSDFVEATFPGYAPIPLPSWSAAYQNLANQGETDELLRTWTQTGATPANTIYGYFVTDQDGSLAWSELRSAGPVVMNVIGATYTVQPIMLLDTLPG